MSGNLTQALRAAHSGLYASQQALDTVARNVSNVNTPGYSRKIVNLEQQMLGSAGVGVRVQALGRRVDEGLLTSLRIETGKLSAASLSNEFYDRIQDLFGTPESDVSLAHTLDGFRGAIESLALSPHDGLGQREVVRRGNEVATQLQRMSQEIQVLRREADQRIGKAVAEINRQTTSIADLNASITRTQAMGQSTADLEDTRDRAFDRLAELLDVRSSGRNSSELVVFTTSGHALVNGASVPLTHVPAVNSGATVTYGEGDFDGIYLGAVEADRDITVDIRDGELAALVRLRDSTLPDLQSALDELAGQLRDTVNEVHNRGVAFPGATRFEGSRVFTEPASQTLAFTGTTDTALVLFDADGRQLSRSTVRTQLTAIGAATPPTVAQVAAAIDAFLGADGAAAVDAATGTLRITVSAAGKTLALRDQATSAAGAAAADAQLDFNADFAGAVDSRHQGFSSFFGLNDFFADRRSAAIHDSAVMPDTWRAPAGTLHVRAAAGALTPGAGVAIAAGDSLRDIADKLAAAAPGVQTAIIPDGAGFRLRIGSADGLPITITSAGGALLGDLGVAVSNAGVASSIAVRADIVAAPRLVARGAVQWDGTRGAAGEYALAPGDDSTVQALAAALTGSADFATAGRLSAARASFVEYAAIVISDASGLAAESTETYEFQKDLVETLRHKSDSVRGVNLDEELSDLMLYEQSYSAAARVVQVVQDMFKALEGILN